MEMTSAPSIRRLAAHEWRAYRELRLRALADSPACFATTLEEARARDEADWKRQVASGAGSPSEMPLVAEMGARLVGLAWCRVDDRDPRQTHLYQMWVDPTLRRRGTGRQLLRAAVRWAESTDAHRVVLSVTCGQTAAIRLYESAGFAPVGDPEPLRSGSELLAQPMQLDLRAA